MTKEPAYTDQPEFKFRMAFSSEMSATNYTLMSLARLEETLDRKCAAQVELDRATTAYNTQKSAFENGRLNIVSTRKRVDEYIAEGGGEGAADMVQSLRLSAAHDFQNNYYGARVVGKIDEPAPEYVESEARCVARRKAEREKEEALTGEGKA